MSPIPKDSSVISSSDRIPIVKKSATLEKNKIFLRSRIRDNYNSNSHSNYNSINYIDRSIIVKKISLSNVFNYNNVINTTNHPINLSLTEKEVFDGNNSFIENHRLNLYNSKRKKVHKVILIQSFIRRFLSYKKYINELQDVKGIHYTKSKIYRKKLPVYKKYINYQPSEPIMEDINEKKIDKNFTNNYFFTKLVIINTNDDKAKISKIQKYWRKRKLNLQIGNYSRISNYQCQSEIVKKYNFGKKINLTKKATYDSLLFSSLHSLKEEQESVKDENKNPKKIQISKDKISVKTNNDIFHKFYLRNKYITRPQYIKLYNKNNQTKREDNEGIYQYEVNDINKTFKDKSFSLFHDKNKNGNYIQQIKSNTGKKIIQIKSCSDINRNATISEYNKLKKYDTDEKLKKSKEYKQIINNLKVWQKNKINSELYEDNINKYKHLKPNKNFICIISSKAEKLLHLNRKRDIIMKPNNSLMKKTNNSIKKSSSKLINMKKALINKNFMNYDENEPYIILERKLIMSKPIRKKK